MTSLNFHLRMSRRSGRHPGRLFIRIIHRRKVGTVSTCYFIYPDEWDKETKRLILPESDPSRSDYLRDLGSRMCTDLERLRMIVSRLKTGGEFTVADIVSEYNHCESATSLNAYGTKVSSSLRSAGQERTARAYRSAVKSLYCFTGGADVGLDEIDGTLIRSYEQYLFDRGLMMNTVSFYMRNLRAIYYRAIRDRIIRQHRNNPFEDVFTGIYQTKRRALDRNEINSLARLEGVLSGSGVLCRNAIASPTVGTTATVTANAREKNTVAARILSAGEREALRRSLYYFMFCYHARGMSFVDLAYLRRQDIGRDVLLYKRKKTGSYMEVKVTRPMRMILNYFRACNPDSSYVFPIIDERCGNLRIQYESGLRMQNKRLKVLSSIAGIGKNLTTHVSRHTWATLAKWSKVHISLISEALGHRDIKTTQTYLASFERSTLDELSVKLSGIIKAA